MKITFVTVSAPAVKNLIRAGREISSSYPDALELKLYYAASELAQEKLELLGADIADSQLVFVDLMGSGPSVIDTVYKGLEKCRGNIIPYGNSAREYMRLGKFTAESMKLEGGGKKPDMADAEKMKDMRNYARIMKYFKVADPSNMLNMLYLLLKEYGGLHRLEAPAEPREVEGIALCDPATMRFYGSLEEYGKEFPLNGNKPRIAMLFYGHIYPTDTSGCVAGIKNRLEEFAEILPIAVSGSFENNREKLMELILNSGKPVELILNFMSFRLGAGPAGGDHKAGLAFLEEVAVPYFHPYFMSRRTVREWEESIQGCSTSEVMISVMLPELDGCLETYPVGAMSEPKYDNEFDITTLELELIPERVENLAARVKRQLALREKKNEDKRVAVICYNYPPGEANLFGGAFLDTFESIENILCRLKGEGYNVDMLSKEQLMEVFTAGKAVNSGKYGGEWEEMIRYADREYSRELLKSRDCKEMLEQWGDVPGSIMSSENHEFLIPGIARGNVFIGLQPSRGIHEESDKVYHDKTLLPHHQYIAFYKWLREEFCADAIIHVGTHGTLEFLKGKECGISGSCYPDMLIGDIPHMYLYYCGNPSEATIAKRRSCANLIGYQPPVFVQGELYGEYSKLMSAMDNYRQSLALAPQSSKEILAEILQQAAELNLPGDIEAIEGELYRMNRSLIPKGLHAFGKGFDREEAMEYAKGLLRYSNEEVSSLYQLVAEAKQLDLEALLEQGDYERIRELEQAAEELFYHYMSSGSLPDNEYIGQCNRDQLEAALAYASRIVEGSQKNDELEGLLRTLAWKYNPAKLAGDIYRQPDILPAGYNLYQFDPRLVPTSIAYARGNRICCNTLETYKKENGTYPLSTAVVLWGIETSRTQGETFSQILAYLGVRISGSSKDWEPRYEIIPISELGRPRIDVTINICGFFRDMFPNLIEKMSDLFERLYELEETDDQNYFKANSRRLYAKLLEEGYSRAEARELSVARIFGPEEGGYGTGLTKLFETKNWEKEEELGSLFLNSLQHVYSRKLHGKKVEGLYQENLKSVEIVSQVRSSHEYEITDLDHYYEFFGGLAKSVEQVKGRRVKMYITDTTGERILTEGVEKAIARGIRTRVLNPKWIDGMLAHKYHGVQKVAERFENVMGLAATTNSVEQWIYNDLHSCYVSDEELRKKLAENNPYAYMNILEQLMEYHSRGYWNATEEQLAELKQVYLELEDSIEDMV